MYINSGTIAAGTNLGNVAMWRYSSNPDTTEDDETCWRLQPPSAIEGIIENITVSVCVIIDKKYHESNV